MRWVFPKIGIPQNGWFIMEIPIKMDDLGVPLFSETPIWTSYCWVSCLRFVSSYLNGGMSSKTHENFCHKFASSVCYTVHSILVTIVTINAGHIIGVKSRNPFGTFNQL